MAMFTPEQEQKLIEAMTAYQKSLRKVEDAQKDLTDKLNRLKTASGLSSSGPQILEEVKSILGEIYLKKIKDGE